MTQTELLNPTYLAARQREFAEMGVTTLELRLAVVEYSTIQYCQWEARAIRDELKARKAGQCAAQAYKDGSSLG